MSDTSTHSTNETERSEAERSMKIQAMREMISNAERTIQSTKAMLLQLEGKKKSGRPRKFDDEADGKSVEGTFDGQHMLGSDGRQYPVPPNYASKSKLVEGDMLKLTITSDGSFVYKQIGPIERRHAIGVVTQDDRGNYYIVADGKPFRVLLASITYFKALPGDEAAIVTPRDIDSPWAAVENIIRKAGSFEETASAPMLTFTPPTTRVGQAEPEFTKATPTFDAPRPTPIAPSHSDQTTTANTTATEPEVVQEGGGADVLNEWIREMEALEKEMEKEKKEDPTDE